MSAEIEGDISDSDELKPVRFVLWLVNQRELNVEKRLMVQVSKSGSACLVKNCDTIM